MIRFAFYFIVNILQFFLKLFFKYFKIFDFAVLVYPGTKNDALAYLPFEFLKKIIPEISIVGFVGRGKNGKRGIIIATKYYIKEIHDKKDEVSMAAEKFAKSINVEKIALVGQLPKILFDDKNSLFVRGRAGTVFTVIEGIKIIMSKFKLPYGKTKIVVVGVGFIGKEVLTNLSKMKFSSIIGFDSRFKEDVIIEENIKKGKNPHLLSEGDLIVILTPHGDDIESIIPFLKNGVIVLDDTHPFLSLKNIRRIETEKNGKVYKAAVALMGVKIFPKFPGFESNWIPGCIVETMVTLCRKEKWINQQDFNQIASKIGFHAIFKKTFVENL